MEKIKETEDKKRNFITYIEPQNKRLFKALAARSGLSMNEILNDLIKKVMNDDLYQIEE